MGGEGKADPQREGCLTASTAHANGNPWGRTLMSTPHVVFWQEMDRRVMRSPLGGCRMFAEQYGVRLRRGL